MARDSSLEWWYLHGSLRGCLYCVQTLAGLTSLIFCPMEPKIKLCARFTVSHSIYAVKAMLKIVGLGDILFNFFFTQFKVVGSRKCFFQHNLLIQLFKKKMKRKETFCLSSNTTESIQITLTYIILIGRIH